LSDRTVRLAIDARICDVRADGDLECTFPLSPARITVPVTVATHERGLWDPGSPGEQDIAAQPADNALAAPLHGIGILGQYRAGNRCRSASARYVDETAPTRRVQRRDTEYAKGPGNSTTVVPSASVAEPRVFVSWRNPVPSGRMTKTWPPFGFSPIGSQLE
jgi:hypothetical protein